MPMPRKPDPEKYCAHCGKRLVRKRWKSGDLESLLHFGRRKYCDLQCFAKAMDAKPSMAQTDTTGHYHARKAKAKGACEVCGKERARDVHHLDGNCHNNSPANLRRICRSCHVLGHREERRCVICGGPHKGLGFCEKHYQRFKKWGDPMLVKPNQHSPLQRSED